MTASFQEVNQDVSRACFSASIIVDSCGIAARVSWASRVISAAVVFIEFAKKFADFPAASICLAMLSALRQAVSALPE